MTLPPSFLYASFRFAPVLGLRRCKKAAYRINSFCVVAFLTAASGMPVSKVTSLPRIVQKENRHSSGCDPMVVAEHSAEALSALNRVMG
jgi:hypothetical protein